jgi:hypothetical protein
MSDRGPSATPPQQSGGGGGDGGESGNAFMDALVGNLAGAMGFEIEETADIEMDSSPWVEREALKFRVNNKGKADSGGVHVYLSVTDQDSQLPILSKDYSEKAVPADSFEDFELPVADLNQLAEDNWAMSGKDYWYLLDEDHRYTFQVYIDEGSGWGEPGTVDFGIELEEEDEDEWGEDDDHSSREEEIEQLQSRLRDLGFYDGEVDRKYGPKTRDAVRQMQRHFGHRSDDGRVNKKVRRVMKHDEEFPKAKSLTY